MDDNLFNQMMVLATMLSTITFAVIEAIKRGFNIPKNFIPLMGIGIGMILGSLFVFSDLSLGPRLWGGALSGLSATGLFELLKPNKGFTDKKIKKEDEE